jgi:hypothetical protein
MPRIGIQTEFVVAATQDLNERIGDRVATINFLLRDRDSRFAGAFDAVCAAVSIRILTSPLGAPRANVICERMIGNAASRAA